MIGKLRRRLSGDKLSAKALRGTGASVLTALSQNGLRLISNLVLTRLLFPEAFGIMALVQVILSGVGMVSDVGVRTSVMQDPRGDEPDFLNTAWTLQIIRGVLLWLLVCLLAVPVAGFYDEPILAQILPVAGFGLVLNGLRPTKALTAQRHLNLGRNAVLTLIGQTLNLVTMSLLAWLWGSVWALVAGLLIGPLISLWLVHRFMPGMPNRLRLERRSIVSILQLGRFLFVSTIATYVVNMSDRAVLGAFVSTDLLGVYAVGFTLATLPWVLAQRVAGSVVFPLYRMRHPVVSPENRKRIFAARRSTVGGALGVSAVMAFAAPALVGLLYDDRYLLAGPIAVLLSLAYVPAIVLIGLMNAAVARGDSFSQMVVNVARAACQIAIMVLGVEAFGIVGAALAIGLAPLLTYPLVAFYMRRYGNWDVRGDIGFFAAGVLVAGTAVWLHWDGIARLLP